METKEKNLEQDIESWLLNEGGYVKAIYFGSTSTLLPTILYSYLTSLFSVSIQQAYHPDGQLFANGEFHGICKNV